MPSGAEVDQGVSFLHLSCASMKFVLLVQNGASVCSFGGEGGDPIRTPGSTGGSGAEAAVLLNPSTSLGAKLTLSPNFTMRPEKSQNPRG